MKASIYNSSEKNNQTKTFFQPVVSVLNPSNMHLKLSATDQEFPNLLAILNKLDEKIIANHKLELTITLGKLNSKIYQQLESIIKVINFYGQFNNTCLLKFDLQCSITFQFDMLGLIKKAKFDTFFISNHSVAA